MKLELTGQILTINAANADGPTRQVDGVAVPWNVEAQVSSGQRVMFLEGSLPVDGPAPKFIRDHDLSKPLGIVFERVSTPEGMLFSAKISATRDGDEALILAADGVLDSVSVGVEPTDYEFEGTLMIVKSAKWEELSLLPFGAFGAAKVVSVAAAEPEEETQDTPTTPKENEVSIETTPIEEGVPTQIFAAPRREVALPSAAEYISAAIAGGSAFDDMRQAIKAAAPNVLTSDTDGILPLPIVQPVYNNFRGLRPVVDAIGAKAMPAGGKVFIRPKVTTNTSMAVQSAENAALQSGTYVVDDLQVTKGTYGGYVNISMQDLSWTQPEVLGLILDDMSRIYANTVDNVAADALLAGTSQSAVLTDPTSPSEWVADIFGAAETILTNSNGHLPTHLFLSPNMWSYLGRLVDTAGRPLFPQVGPMNAFGTVQAGSTEAVAFGLRVVVDRNFAADTVIVGAADGFEIFEDMRGALSLESPSTLSRTLAWHGYFSTLMIDATKFVKLT